MDEIIGYMDGRFDVSLADSTMMSIVHSAMNKAQEKMKNKTGVLERLNEISKFYELAVMQLEGCLTIVRAETESSFLETNHEKLLDDLREIKDRLQGRLEESESIILEKDRELSQRLKKYQSHKVKSDGDLCDLRSSMDQQMLNIKQRLEPQQNDIVENVTHSIVVNDTKKIEEMGSDIDVLKQTMDLAFGKMQNSLFSCEMRPKERQWKLKIEKDMISILITSFMKEFKENIEVEARRNENHVMKCWQEHWSQMMNDLTSLKNELSTMHETFPEESDSSALSSPTKASLEEGTHETLHRSPPNADERDHHKEGESQEEEENESRSLVAKMIKNHESIIRQKNEELNRIKHLQEKKASSSSKKRKELYSMKDRIHVVSERLNNLIKWNEKQGESFFNKKATHDKEPFSGKKLSSSQECDIDMEKLIQENVHKCYLKEMMNELNENNERKKIQRKIREDINCLVFFEEIKDIKSNQNFVLVKESLEGEIEGIIKEDICMLIIKKTIEQFNKIMTNRKVENIVREQKESLENEIEGVIKEDICMLVIKKTIEQFNKIMTNCKVENIIREQIDEIVLEETLDIFVNISNSSSNIDHRKNINIQDNFSTMIQNQVQKFQGQENFSTMIQNQVQKFQGQENFSSMIQNHVQKFQGQENLTIILLESLLSCFEAEENLMLSAQSEIKEHSKQLDLGSERGDLGEHEIFEDLLIGEEQAFSSLTSKVENVLQQLGISKALLKELGTSLGHGLRDSEIFHQQKLCSFESPTFEEFEGIVFQKLDMMSMRLENMKSYVDLVTKMIDCLKRNELLYQKAFIRRCQNLQNAEAEVDLLGDQVDALLTLLEKIYVTLHKHAPTLQQHFEVFNILELIKTELIGGAVHVANVVVT